jgi:DNA polymerase-3 subunit epsilon
MERNYKRGQIMGARAVIDMPPLDPYKAARWIKRHRRGVVFWDTETTGLDDDSKIVSIGIVGTNGETLLNTLINPGEPIPASATKIHGVTNDDVKHAPSFPEVYQDIRRHLHKKIWVIYNKGYDIPRLNYEIRRHHLADIEPATQGETMFIHGVMLDSVRELSFCAMQMFAPIYGAYSDYHESYTWQSLTTAAAYYNIPTPDAHNALADALTTYQLINQIAYDDDKEQTA